MQATDVRPSRVSQTMPGAIQVSSGRLGADPPSETPRFGWCRFPDFEVVTHAYRVVMAFHPTLEDESWEIKAPPLLALGDARVWVMTDDPWATDDAGVGYRFYQRPFTAQTGLSLRRVAVEPGTPGRLLYHELASVAKLAGNVVLQGVGLQEMCNVLITGLTHFSIGLRDEESKLHVLVNEANQVTAPALLPGLEQDTHVSAVRWLEEHANLSQEAIGELVGVSRQTVHNWLYKRSDIRDENRQRLLAVREILERVQRRHHGSDALKTWLDTPRAPEAKTPRQLLIANEIGKARALSLSTAAARTRSAPTWLREAPPDSWTLRQRRRRERFARGEAEEDSDHDDSPDSSDPD